MNLSVTCHYGKRYKIKLASFEVLIDMYYFTGSSVTQLKLSNIIYISNWADVNFVDKSVKINTILDSQLRKVFYVNQTILVTNFKNEMDSSML